MHDLAETPKALQDSNSVLVIFTESFPANFMRDFVVGMLQSSTGSNASVGRPEVFPRAGFLYEALTISADVDRESHALQQ